MARYRSIISRPTEILYKLFWPCIKYASTNGFLLRRGQNCLKLFITRERISDCVINKPLFPLSLEAGTVKKNAKIAQNPENCENFVKMSLSDLPKRPISKFPIADKYSILHTRI